MSMKPHELEPIPEETRRIASRSFRKGTLIMHLRDALGTIYHDEDLRDLFPRRGRPAEAPWRLALVTVMQAVEHLTDRQAAEMVRGRIDWKYALSLPLDDPGFDYTVLSQFRDRLLQADLTEKLLEPILKVARRESWLKTTEQRTDSTHVLAAVRELSTVECVGETFRAALNDLAEQAPTWLAALAPDTWFERYVDRIDLQRVSKSHKKRVEWRDQLGKDGWMLLQAVRAVQAPQGLAQRPSVLLLDQVWQQHFEQRPQGVHWRAGPLVSEQDRVLSPYDVDARHARKRSTEWIGYKCHLTETCSQEPGRVNLIVQVHTTPATTHDGEALDPILQEAEQRGVGSREHWVDQGYMSGERLVAQREKQRELIGPVAYGQGWQSRQEGGLTVEDFVLDRAAKVAICPQGQASRSWKSKQDRRGKSVEEIRFSISTCRGCPLKEHCCSSAQTGRILSLPPQEQYEALQERREEQEGEAFRQKYALRAGIEATISQAVRTAGLRQSPYRGQDKTHLHHVVIAAAVNLVRMDQHLQRQQTRPQPRPLSPFKKLQRAG